MQHSFFHAIQAILEANPTKGLYIGLTYLPSKLVTQVGLLSSKGGLPASWFGFCFCFFHSDLGNSFANYSLLREGNPM